MLNGFRIIQRLPILIPVSTAGFSNGHEDSIFIDVFWEENKERVIDRLRSIESVDTLNVTKTPKRAAVLVPLCLDTQGRPSLLFTLRSKGLNKHSGEASFPGGAADPEDQGNLITTALRGTEEELGISRDLITIWGKLPIMASISSNFGVVPIVGLINDPIDPSLLRVNPAEVAEAFTTPLEHLCEPKDWKEMDIEGFLCPSYNNLSPFRKDGGDDTIWGLTAIATHVLLSVMVPEKYGLDLPWMYKIARKSKLKL